MAQITVAEHPLLDLRAFRASWPDALGAMGPPAWLDALVTPEPVTPLAAPDQGATDAVRAMLRHGGFKPSGRSKPCNEYIRRVAGEGTFPRISPVVDLTNLAALHGGLPVSTVDPDRLTEPLRVEVAVSGASYVFNASGQTIDLGGLICLHDAEGPCANAVKDAQRAKTTPDSRRTLTLIWGTRALAGRADALLDWHVEMARRLGGAVEVIA
ncbi:MAG: hypothetical protein H6735_00985 [Alphaproteobacteria bacterium]|nr:hypothetical protein [Alphaproteobacteria bacterium]